MNKKETCRTVLIGGGVLALGIYCAVYTANYAKQVETLKQSIIQQQDYTNKQELKLKEKDKQLQETERRVKESQQKIDELKESIKNISVNTEVPKETFNYLVKVAKENDFKPELLFAIIQQESRWNTRLVSETNDYGLCQINEVNFEDYEKRLANKHPNFDIFDVHTNIDCMILNLNDTRNRYRKQYESEPSLETMLLAYNSGRFVQTASRGRYSSGVIGYMGEYKEWLNYVQSIQGMSNLQ
jgi:Soluble lytic murein transglycosylase and related regulatory proteins (some contain LysM/invasin domains)